MEYIRRQLMDLYRGIRDGIADGIAIEQGNKVYIVDSGRENGKLDFGVRRQRTINDARLRRDFIRRTNDNTVSNGNVSDELLERLGYGVSSDSGRDLRRESGSELQADTRKSENNQSGVSQKNADSERGLKDGKASQELDLIDYINERAEAARNGNELRAYKASEKMLQNRQLLANALESINEYPSEKGLLSSYRATAERLQRAEQRIAEIETDIAALSKDEKNAQAIDPYPLIASTKCGRALPHFYNDLIATISHDFIDNRRIS